MKSTTQCIKKRKNKYGKLKPIAGELGMAKIPGKPNQCVERCG